jgi:hypothetical protein
VCSTDTKCSAVKAMLVESWAQRVRGARAAGHRGVQPGAAAALCERARAGSTARQTGPRAAAGEMILPCWRQNHLTESPAAPGARACRTAGVGEGHQAGGAEGGACALGGWSQGEGPRQKK